MADTMVAQVRRFNRVVTERVGALDDRYLARDRPLGQARLLWEIGDGCDDGCDVRSLRSRLDLDSGYLSRLLRSLEAAGLVTVDPSDDDKRVRTARLTAAGSAERAVLDLRSDELARSFLEPLGEAQRTRLVAAMADVERLLTAVLIDVVAVDPALSIPAELDELRPPAGVLLVATLRSEPIGCGALKFHPGQPTELKRMWVAASARGLGIGRRLLSELEARAAANGSRVVRLETNKSLVEAIGLYRSAGYREVDAFNDEPYAHHWFEKRLS